jgi:L-ascorbate metabolism protein UlaG (beta-lactamase superfamily)
MKFTRRLLTGFATLEAAIGGGAAEQSPLNRDCDGPVYDYFDGLRFFDIHGSPPKTFGDLLRWQISRTRAKWPAHVPNLSFDEPPARVGKGIRLSFVGHASVLIQTAGLNILTDPIWSARASPVSFAGPKRVNDPGIKFDSLPPIDFVLVTHCHYDHLDVETLSRLTAKYQPRVITPLGNDTIMRAYDSAIKAEAYEWNRRVDLGSNFAVTPVPSRHWSARGLFDRNKALWSAFMIETPNGKIYFVGDSGYGEGHHFKTARERHAPIKLAILPIGAYEPRWFMHDHHMNPEESVRAFQDCGAEFALAHHFGTFQLTDEAIDAPREALKAALGLANISPERFRAINPGQVWEIA